MGQRAEGGGGAAMKEFVIACRVLSWYISNFYLINMY